MAATAAVVVKVEIAVIEVEVPVVEVASFISLTKGGVNCLGCFGPG